MSKKTNKKTNSEKKGNESITSSTLNSVETVAERDEPVTLTNAVDFEQGNLGKEPLNLTISEKSGEVRSFGQISPLGVKLSDELCSAPNVSERASMNYPYEKDNTCSSREIKSAIVSKDSDEKKSREARNYKAIIKRAILLKKKGEDCGEILTELFKSLSIPPEEEMEDDVVPLYWEDSDDDNINMDLEGTYEKLALRSGEEEDASSPVRVEEEEDASSRAMVEEEKGASSQQEILTPTALRRAVVEQISITPVGEIPDFSRKQKSRVDTISEEEYQRYILVPSWHRYFAILEVLRAGGVLDEDIGWDEMVTLHFGQNRPKYYRFKNMTFDGEDTTGVLKMFSKEQGLWIYSPVAGVDTIDQITYAKSQSKDDISWSGNIIDFIRSCQLAQDKYAVEQNQMLDTYGTMCVTAIQAKRICAEILKMVNNFNNKELKDILTTYQRSATDPWYLNSS